MPKCVNCGKKSIFLSVDANGLCRNCSSELKNAPNNKKQEINGENNIGSSKEKAENFFDIVMNEYLVVMHSKKYISDKPNFVSDVYNAGNTFTYSWLSDDELANACETTMQLFHNVAIHAIFGGAFFAYAWTNNPKSFDPDNLYAIFRISDGSSLGTMHLPYSKNEMIDLASELFRILYSLL